MGDGSKHAERAKLILSIALACVIGAILAAITAAVILRYVDGPPSSRFDDVEEILAEYQQEDLRGVSIAADGGLTVRLEKEDLYWYANDYGILSRFQEYISQLPSGWQVKKYGFHIEDGGLTIYVTARQGLFPVTFRADYAAVCQGTVMYLHPIEVSAGGYAELDEDRWPDMLPREGFVLDFAQMGISSCLRSVRLEGSALVLEADGLSQAMSGQLLTDSSLLNALRAYGTGSVDAWGVLSWLMELGTEKVPMAEAQNLVLSSGGAAEALAELLACCTGGSRQQVLGGWDRFTLEFAAILVQESATARRAELERYIAAEQWKYEKLLTSVREMYKSGALCLEKRGFSTAATGAVFDPAALTGSLSLTSIDSRPVLLISSRGGAQGVRTTDMPPLGSIPRSGDKVVQGADWDTVCDLGMLMTTENGVPALLYYRNDGVLVIRELPESLYTALLLDAGNPVVDVDTLWTPEERTVTPSAMGMSSYEILLLEE